MKITPILAAWMLWIATAAWGGGPDARVETGERGPEAFSQPIRGLTEPERERFSRGRALVRQSWIVAPSKDSRFAGLGPLYNRLACISCHPRNGRGVPPESADERMLSMLVRLSIPGASQHGGPKPHSAYGDQLNEEGIPGVPGEGRAALHWEEASRVMLSGGDEVILRRPRLEFRELAYGPLDPVLTSPRVGQQLVGLGLLEAIPNSTLLGLAKQSKPDGVRGRVNRVWNPSTLRMEVGRFGFKSNMPTLRAQSAGAFVGDLGITSSLFPRENCTDVQTACRRAPSGGHPELTNAQLDDVEFYLAHLAVPSRRDVAQPLVREGEAHFAALGCVHCHRPNLETAKRHRFHRLSGLRIAPYTDLLIHDLGDGLSDGRPDYLASGNEWRTPPLWGLGLSEIVGDSPRYLHDGRARTLNEAILWHGGEANVARSRFVALSPDGRKALLAFLGSL